MFIVLLLFLVCFCFFPLSFRDLGPLSIGLVGRVPGMGWGEGWRSGRVGGRV